MTRSGRNRYGPSDNRTQERQERRNLRDGVPEVADRGRMISSESSLQWRTVTIDFMLKLGLGEIVSWTYKGSLLYGVKLIELLCKHVNKRQPEGDSYSQGTLVLGRENKSYPLGPCQRQFKDSYMLFPNNLLNYSFLPEVTVECPGKVESSGRQGRVSR